MTKLTTRLRAWSDRVLLTPVLRGAAKPFRLLWAAIVFIATQIWRWTLRPVWRWALWPIWRWVLRPVLWLPLRWIGLQIWRWALGPIWRRVLRPVLWLPLRWIGLQIWRWVLRPLWSLLRWAGAVVLASPWILARTLPNRGWLTGSVVLALTAAVLIAPGKVNEKTQSKQSQVVTGPAAQNLGTLRPEMTVSLAAFTGWHLEPFDDQHRELVLRRDEAELRILRADNEQNAEDYLSRYARLKLGVRNPGRFYPQRVTVKDANGKPVQVLQIEQEYRVTNLRHPDLAQYHQIVLYNYGTAVLLLVFTVTGTELKSHSEQIRALKASVRITP